jgi:predicted double-glycine peptidase
MRLRKLATGSRGRSAAKRAGRARRAAHRGWLISVAVWSIAWPIEAGTIEVEIPTDVPAVIVPPKPYPFSPKYLENEFLARPKRPPRSWRAMRDAGLVRQAFDYSCGSAALATLLSSADAPVTEGELLHQLLDGLTRDAKVRTMEAGLSLLDLKNLAESRGFRAAGYRVEPDLLPTLTRPVLVFIQPRGYKHFAVLRGVRGDRVYLADPGRGNARYPIWRFLDMWLDEQGRGVIFVVDSQAAAPLEFAEGSLARPELLGARQMIQIGNPYLRLPHIR